MQEPSRQNIDLDQSPDMNEEEQALFLNIQKSRSQDSFIGKLLPNPGETYQRGSLVLEPMGSFTPIAINNINFGINRAQRKSSEDNIRVFKKIKKNKIKNRCDYDKNICGYITKKVIREFIGKHYEKHVHGLCHKYKCSYRQVKSFYTRRIQCVTGPSHIPELIRIQSTDSPEQIGIKQVFRQFFEWFLKYRYVRYLLREGKMKSKLSYIQYKNNHLLKCLAEHDQTDKQMIFLSRRLKSRSKSKSRGRIKEEEEEKGIDGVI